MAAERRSLAAGVEQLGGVDPEAARAFIVQEGPREGKPSPVRVAPEPSPDFAVEPGQEPKLVTEQKRGGESPVAAVKRQPKPTAAKRPDTVRLLSTLLVPVTIRLRPEIASALKRASLQRQLNGIETYTQQDIVEEALLPWLQAEGLFD